MKLIFKMEKKISDFKLERNVRAHGNFSEYVPLFLILLMIIETKLKISFNYLIIICIVFLYGRLAHAICFSFYKHNPFLRISGMICTYLSLLVFSIISIGISLSEIHSAILLNVLETLTPFSEMKRYETP